MSELKLAIEAYVTDCADVRRLSPHTVNAYRNDLMLFANSLRPITLVADMMPSTIRNYLVDLARGQKLAPATVRRRVAVIRSFVRVVDAQVAEAVFGTWRLAIQAPKRLPRALSKTDLQALLQSDEEEERAQNLSVTRLCLTLLVATGLRISELCSLRIGDLQQRSGEIRVMGKGSRERVVVVTNVAVRAALAAHIRELAEPTDLDAPLFCNLHGRAITPQCLRLRLHRLAAKCGLRRTVTPHMLRHTAATLLLEAGVDIRFVQQLLGHASIATTQIYTYVTDVALRNALQRANVMQPYV